MRIALDHETFPIKQAKLAPRIVCTSWIDAGKPRLELWQDTPIREMLGDPNTMLDGANTAYDLTCEMASDHELIPLIVQLYIEGRVQDVLLDAKLCTIAEGEMYEGRKFSLQALAAEIGIALEKDDWRLRYGALDGVPVQYWPIGARDYALWDPIATEATRADITRRAALIPRGIVLGQTAQVAAGADWALHLASCWGVCTDSRLVESLAERTQAYITSLEGDLIAAGLVRREGSKEERRAYAARLRAEAKRTGMDVTQLRQRWTMLGDGDPDGKKSDLAAAVRMIDVMTAKGRRRDIALSDKGEEELQARVARGEDRDAVHEELLGQIRRGRMLVKLDADSAILSGDEPLINRAIYVSSNLLLGRVEDMRQGVRLPLQTNFDSIKETFRTSSSKPKLPELVGLQMQNFGKGDDETPLGALTKDAKHCFVPRNEDSIFIGGDVSMAELCSLAELCWRLFGVSDQGELINAGVDLHWDFAASSLSISIEEVMKLGKKHRSRAKPSNFGFPGGMGIDKFILYSRKGYGVIFTPEEAKAAKQAWLRRYREMRLYLDLIGEWCSNGKFTHVHPITGYVRGNVGYPDGANHGFQHPTAYAMKVALIELTAATFDVKNPLFGYHLWNFVHDEVLFEGPREPERASAAAFEVKRITEDCYNRFVPNFRTKVDTWVSRRWSKENETVKDAFGRIVECAA